ncbi:hypothetical protein [Brevibacillus centrosporus]|uniref:hypothetical protein n=1 Tax=Brevibacillus centrosporus TaxID=54910 RepID=UPI0039876A03
MNAFKQKNFSTKSGGKYIFQHPGVRTVSKINDSSKNKYGVVMEERLAEEILKHVVVDPKMKIDDFNNYSEYKEVINAAYAFISGQDQDGDEDGNQQEGSEG